MKRTAFLLFLVPFLALNHFACAARPSFLPAHDEVLIYSLPFDLVYLRTLEALELDPDWDLEETEKEKGTIRVRNVNFTQFADQDKRTAVFLVKRISRGKTSVELAPESQRVLGTDRLLQLVSQHVSREL